MANVNQAKFVLFIFCIFLVMQTSACESKRQVRIQEESQHRIVASEK